MNTRNSLVKKEIKPFEIEQLRSYYALNKNSYAFLSTYKKSTILENPNTKVFWNDKYAENIMPISPMKKNMFDNVYKILLKYHGKFLNIGFGEGILDNKLANNTKLAMHGIEISDIAVDNIKKNVDGDYKIGSILKIDYPDNYFDIVLAMEVLEHITASSIFISLKEIYRVLKTGGIVIITVPVNERLDELVASGINPNGHMRTYDYPIISYELELSGYRVVFYKYYIAFKSLYVIKNMISKLIRNKWKPNDLLIVAQKI